MTGIEQNILLGVARVRAHFVDNIGNCEPVTGTGFWLFLGPPPHVAPDAHVAFVTNKHIVDPRMKKGDKWRTERIELELRRHEGRADPDMIGVREGTKWFEVRNLHESLFADDAANAADCAAIVDPDLGSPQDEGFGAPTLLHEGLLATEFDFRSNVAIGDALSFIGYPVTWWDQRFTLAISRPAWIASWPAEPFTHAEIATADALLVTGLSFAGNSGSAVIAHAKMPRPSQPPFAARVIGIMSGHFKNVPGGQGLPHSGLSYLTRSTSMRRLIEGVHAAAYRSSIPYSGLAEPRAEST